MTYKLHLNKAVKKKKAERKGKEVTETQYEDCLPFQPLPRKRRPYCSKLQAPGSDLESSGQAHGQHLAKDHAWEGGVPAKSTVEEARTSGTSWNSWPPYAGLKEG